MKKTVIALIIVTSLVLGTLAIAFAQQTYHDELILIYSFLKSSKIDKTCLCCHFIQEGTGPRNPYGVMYENTEELGDFEEFESFDADGDGYTNIQELKAKTYPGDFRDHPAPLKWNKCVTFFSSIESVKKTPISVCVVNGVSTDLTPHGGPCYIKGGKTMVPLRIGIESLGGTVIWDGKERRIDIKKGNTLVGQMWVGKRMAKIGGKNYDLITPPEVNAKGKTFVPVKGVGDALGATLIWVNRGKIANFVLK